MLLYIILYILIGVNLYFQGDKLEAVKYIFLGLYNYLFIIIFIQQCKNNFFNILIKSLKLTTFIFIIISFIFNSPFENIDYSYNGIFSNSNIFGAICMLAIITLMTDKYYKKIEYHNIAYIVMLLVLIDRSDSRTAFIISIFWIIYCFLFKCFKLNYKMIFKYLVVFLCIIIYLKFMRGKQLVNLNVIEKFLQTINQNSITSGRSEMWLSSFKDINFLGNGINYFAINFNGLSAHNSYIHLLICFGIIPFLNYLLINIFTLVKSLKGDNKETSILVISIILLQFIEITFGSIGNIYNLIFMMLFYLCTLDNCSGIKEINESGRYQ